MPSSSDGRAEGGSEGLLADQKKSKHDIRAPSFTFLKNINFSER